MYNILIVDDDPDICEELTRFVSAYREKNRAELMPCRADNGQQAVEIVCSRPIDVIFSDVKMPVCTGIQMMEKLRKLGYGGQVVVISGFDDYDLIRASMKLGAEDYLLKPVVQEEFWTILGECLERASERKNSSGLSPVSGKSMLETVFREQHLLEQLLSGETVEDMPGETVWLCDVDVFRKRDPDDMEKEAAFLRFQKMAGELYGNGKKMLQGCFRNVWVLLFFSPTTAEAPQALGAWMRRQNLRFTVSRHAVEPRELPDLFSGCAEKLNEYFYDIPDLFTEIEEPFPYERTMKAIVKAVGSCDFITFSGYLSQLFATLCREKPKLEDTRHLLLSIPYQVMSYNNEFIEVISQYRFSDQDVTLYIEGTTSAMELRRKIIELFNLYIRAVRDNRVSRDSYNVQKTKQFLGTYYMQNISLKDISNKLGINPNYLSTVFHNESGMTFTQYLRGLRVRKATEMMRGGSLKIYEIAAKVGYENEASFYRAFREETGVSPIQYKNLRETNAE